MTKSRITLSAIFFALLFGYPLWLHPTTATSFWDWDFAMQLTTAAYRSIAHYHQLPLWNPYKCGGAPLLANPQTRIWSPLFSLTLLFGPALGVHLELLIDLMLAWAGGFFLGRTLRMKDLGCIVVATVYAGSSWFPVHIAAGELVLAGFCYLPFLLAFSILGVERDLRWAILAGATLAMMAFAGSAYPETYGGLLIAGLFLFCYRNLRALGVLAIAGGCGLLLIAPELWLGYKFISDHARPEALDYANPIDLWNALVSRNQDLHRNGSVWSGWFEFGNYVGWFLLPALVTIAVDFKRAWWWLILAALCCAIFLGGRGPYYPWSLLHHLPIFYHERWPYRAGTPLVLIIAILAGFGIDHLYYLYGNIILCFVALAAFDLWWVGAYNLRYPFESSVVTTPDSFGSFRQLREASSGYYSVSRDMLILTRENHGAVDCYDYSDWSSAVAGVGKPNYRGELYFTRPDDVSDAALDFKISREILKEILWTPNRLEFMVDLALPNILIINQNYNAGWKLIRGEGRVISDNGLLAIELPKRRQDITLKYSAF